MRLLDIVGFTEVMIATDWLALGGFVWEQDRWRTKGLAQLRFLVGWHGAESPDGLLYFWMKHQFISKDTRNDVAIIEQENIHSQKAVGTGHASFASMSSDDSSAAFD
uniref:Uncharacterized protein n=1 Tax=Entomoneis paludosa TaxID=265537 RepID=A0A7S2YD38_9STRA|mmetsp:Transcript_28052/g.58742  ORF Transcript_28052/g.58742 Transcript_28052/m.58742 type:complete len:107 (+) Transcript_28052:89-409(+)